MPTVSYEDGFRFVIYPNDHAPPHVHVKFEGGQECRIDLVSGDFMDTPPRGTLRKIMRAYFENIEEIWTGWEKFHHDEP